MKITNQIWEAHSFDPIWTLYGKSEGTDAVCFGTVNVAGKELFNAMVILNDHNGKGGSLKPLGEFATLELAKSAVETEVANG